MALESPSESKKNLMLACPQTSTWVGRQEVNMILSRKCSLADSLLQQMFIVRFLGSMAVKTDNTTEVIYEAMRQVLAARAIHNIFRMTESHLMVTSQTLRYVVSFSDFLTASDSLLSHF